jgi:methylenetetrahydrofolate dehydrogenase (NADP+)/methenyltetrahydrofolate cyclohydrolase
VAVVGSRGFVGQGVTRLLRAQGLDVIGLDIGDDLGRVRDANIVVSATGSPGVLGPGHLHPDHRLVIDTGFVPQPNGSVTGDIRPEAYSIPQRITPVPGGIGPVEMAVLLERVLIKEAAPSLPHWQISAETLHARIPGLPEPILQPEHPAPGIHQTGAYGHAKPGFGHLHRPEAEAEA